MNFFNIGFHSHLILHLWNKVRPNFINEIIFVKPCNQTFYGITIIQEANQRALDWVNNIPKEKWTQLWNSMFKGTRNLPVTFIVQSTYYRLVCLFAERAQGVFARVGSGDVFNEYCVNVVKDDINSNTYHVEQFFRKRYTFSVCEASTTGREGQMVVSIGQI
ncbi:hypothetical protein MTR_7g092950 [Medicago truncatula]|uniref:Uncharacterized protein n=1 Tax=Medicago truncatula TaxID=3880 RepID=G7KVB4_MEDTR|nr:hypothetical protein MTR_7g092950 [Medicago truncatula]